MGCSCLKCETIEEGFHFPEKDTKAFNESALDLHNQYRKEHYVDMLQLDDNMCQKAQKKLEKLRNQKNENNETLIEENDNDYGENLWIGKIKEFNKDKVKEACTSWYNEINNYKFGSNKYQSGTGHFTQMIWKETRRIGFGYLRSQNNNNIYFLALYYPPGNKLFEFKKNVINNKTEF